MHSARLGRGCAVCCFNRFGLIGLSGSGVRLNCTVAGTVLGRGCTMVYSLTVNDSGVILNTLLVGGFMPAHMARLAMCGLDKRTQHFKLVESLYVLTHTVQSRLVF